MVMLIPDEPGNDVDYAVRRALTACKTGRLTARDAEAAALWQDHQQDTRLIQEVAGKCRLGLSDLIFNDHMELYYDLYNNDLSVGYVAKGWRDPGFRIGDLIEFPRDELDRWKAFVPDLFKFGAARGIVMMMEEAGPMMHISLETVLYREGFNLVTFRRSLESICECNLEALRAWQQ